MVQKRASSIRKNYKFQNLFYAEYFGTLSLFVKSMKLIYTLSFYVFLFLYCLCLYCFMFDQISIFFFNKRYLIIKACSRQTKKNFFFCIQRASSIRKNYKFQNRFLCRIFWYFKALRRIDDAHLQVIFYVFYVYIVCVYV